MHAISGPSALPQPSGDADVRTWRIGRPIANGGVVLGSGGRVFRSRRPPADATPLPAHEQMHLRQRAHALPALLGVTLLLICGVYVFSR